MTAKQEALRAATEARDTIADPTMKRGGDLVVAALTTLPDDASWTAIHEAALESVEGLRGNTRGCLPNPEVPGARQVYAAVLALTQTP